MTRTTVIHELTHDAALTMLNAAVRVLASLRMTGAKFASLETATAKAVSAASNRVASGAIPAQFENLVALATHGQITNLQGGLPIVINGDLCGAIGVGRPSKRHRRCEYPALVPVARTTSAKAIVAKTVRTRCNSFQRISKAFRADETASALTASTSASASFNGI